MGLFGNQPSQNAPPVDAVAQLRSQQRSDHEIIDELSKQGYSSIDIYNALNQADQGQPAPQNQASQGQAPQGQDPQGQDPYAQQYAPPDAQSAPDPFANQADQYTPPQEQFQAQPQQEQYGQSQSPQSQPSQPSGQDPWQNQNDDPWSNTNIVHAQPSQPQAPAPQQPSAPSQPAPSQPQPPPQRSQPTFSSPQRSQERSSGSTFGGSDATIDQIDQVAEAIIDEKWKEMKAYIEKIVDWKGKVENRIIAVEENQKMLNEQIVGLQKTMLDKVQTYDRHITDVGTEIKAMEKVFQKIIPSLTENVNELSSVVHRMKDDQ